MKHCMHGYRDVFAKVIYIYTLLIHVKISASQSVHERLMQ